MIASTDRDFDSTDSSGPDARGDVPTATTVLALRAKEAARALGIGERQLWSLTNAGQIPHVRIGRSVVYHVASLDAWLRKRAKGGK